MKIRKIATITFLALSSFAANNVAPSQVELEAMYDTAFREFNANNYPQALKELDAIDARQPDLAESRNLRGVIAMREGNYDQAEEALQKALAADPKFWNARFNLAEIPFLKKNWTEARNRFEGLLSGNKTELQGEALQLIQYKILLTYLLEGKENMVDSIRAKLELSPDTPAIYYANAAIAFQRKNEAEAKDAIVAAGKKFSPQLNKLFVESLYEIGWLQKPAGQSRAALELTPATERAAKTKEFTRAKFEQAERAFQQRDLTAAKKLVDEADVADPNQAPTLNLRGLILLEEKDFDAAEGAFKQAQKADPKMQEASNLAQIPFKKKEYAKARDRFEALLSATPGGDKSDAAQLIKFQIYLTLLLEGKDSRAQKMMEQFQFSGDTPALYYAQAAWEFKHNNAAKANDWVGSARKIYSSPMNTVFADAFYDVGWLQKAASPASAVAEAKVAAPPPIEPSPIPGAALAANNAANPPANTAPQKSPLPTTPVEGMEATTANGEQPAVTSAQASQGAKQTTSTASQPPTIVARESAAPSAQQGGQSAALPAIAQTTASATPATVLAPATVREWSQPTFGERLERFLDARSLLFGGLLLAGVIILAWVVVPEVRRRVANVPIYQPVASAGGPPFGDGAAALADGKKITAPARSSGGPPKVSLQLKASKPSMRRAAAPFSKPTRPFGSGNAIATPPAYGVSDEPPSVPPAEDPVLHEDVGAPIAEIPEAAQTAEISEPEVYAEAPTFIAPTEKIGDAIFESAVVVEEARFAEPQPVAEAAQTAEISSEPEVFAEAPAFGAPAEEIGDTEANELAAVAPEPEPALAKAEVRPIVEAPSTSSEAVPEPIVVEASIADAEPIGQGQPIPYQVPAIAAELAAPVTAGAEPEERPSLIAKGLAAAAAFTGIGAFRRSLAQPASIQETIQTEDPTQQPTTPAMMPKSTQPTPDPAAGTPPTSTPGAVPQSQPQAQPADGMQTAVQITFSFEITSLQLTPSLKMGALQLKPTSKIVTMRLAPSQEPKPAMNLQVTFEIATVQLAGNSLGQIRLTPSQQQKPGMSGSPAFNISDMQLLSGDNSAVQMTPSQQGQASVLVTAPFQIATVEFSPSFEMAALVLNSTSKSVLVQLPGAGETAVEGAPVFEISNVQLAGNGEISMMLLSPQSGGQQPTKPR